MDEVPHQLLGQDACHLGEGPTYDLRTNTAWWFDILERRLFEADPASGDVRVHEMPSMASELAVIDDERQLVATERGLFVRDRASGAMTLLQLLEAEDAGTRSNDGRVHPSGALWIGTMGRNAEDGAGSIYWFREGELRKLYANISIPNAIAFTRDGTSGTFVDTRANRLMRVALDPATGLPAGEPQVFFDHSGGEGGIDGAVFDRDGTLWAARWGASCVDAYGPDGTRLRTVRVPATRPSCPIFVGPDLDRMLVTTAQEGMSAEERAADPLAGRTFLLDVGAKGFPEPRARPFAP